MILLKTVILFYKKHLSFAAAHSPKNSKLYDDILEKNKLECNFYICNLMTTRCIIYTLNHVISMELFWVRIADLSPSECPSHEE